MKKTEKKSPVKLLLRIVALCIVVLFLGYNIYLWNLQSMQSNMLPMPFGIGAAVVLSGSMEPSLGIDDLIIVKAQDDYLVDDVVVYQSGNSLIVHRIISIDGETVITQGDANNTPDEAIDAGLISGKVVGSVQNVGWVVRLLKAPTVSFGIMALAIFLMERSFRKDKTTDSQKMDQLQEEIRRLQAEQET